MAMKPPSAISTQPPQIQSTKGLIHTSIVQRPSGSFSPRATYTSPVRRVSMAASV